MSSTNSNLFNVADVSGKDQVALETTVAEARISAPNPHVARQIERNASQEQQAAEQAASVAKTLGSNLTGEPSTAVDQLKGDAARTTRVAVAEGKHDVEGAKAAGAGYVEQAKGLATSAIETAQAYLPTALGGKSAQADHAAARTAEQGHGILASVEATAGSVYTSVAAAAQPTIERAKEVAQPHLEQAKGVAQKYMGTAGVQGAGAESKLHEASVHNTGVSRAPLESGPHTVDAPYPPSSAAVKGTDIAASGGKPTTHN